MTLSAFALVATAGAVSLGSVYPALRSIRLLNDGKYREAEVYLRGLLTSYEQPTICNAARYNLAVALHRDGRFQASLTELDILPLHELDPSLHGAANALYAWNLIFLRRDLDRARQCIQAAGPLAQRATTQFALAYIHMLQGDRAAADRILHSVTSRPAVRQRIVGAHQGSALVIDRKFEAIIEEHLLGLCAYERRDLPLARAHFLRVANARHPSFYPRHAVSYLNQIGAYPAPMAA